MKLINAVEFKACTFGIYRNGNSAAHISFAVIALYPIVAFGKFCNIFKSISVSNGCVAFKEIRITLHLAVIGIDFKACCLGAVNAFKFNGNAARKQNCVFHFTFRLFSFVFFFRLLFFCIKVNLL